jgi:hypothetical protein
MEKFVKSEIVCRFLPFILLIFTLKKQILEPMKKSIYKAL